jgi:DNA processing protein
MSDNTRTVLALSRLPRIRRAQLKAILEHLADDRTAASWPESLERFKGSLPELSTKDLDVALAQADELLERCQSLGVALHPFGSPSYPPQLARLADPPALLFSIGRFDFQVKPRIAVIGTRKPTSWGVKTAKSCAAQIAESEGVVVSGLALGIDTAAQLVSVMRHRPTWAVLAHGLHTVLPSSNRKLARLIVEQGGALVSEYAPGEPAERHYFIERDRIQAGLSDAVLVIETGLDGGAMHTVRFARQAGVPVWATFPDTKMRAGEARRHELPKAQQGTWELLRTKRAARVATVKTLEQMTRDLVSVV